MTQRGRARVRPAWLRGAALMGPAFVASIAYIDPGNVAANVSAGAEFGLLLLWVQVMASLMAMLIQYQSAKLGIVTGHTMPELLAERMPRTGRLLYWVQAEIAAGATDVAEVVGGAIALQLLFGLPLIVGGVIIGAASLVLLLVQNTSQRRFEFAIMALLAVIAVGFTVGALANPLPWGEMGEGLLPRFNGANSVLLAVSMLGATVMPHAIYLHSGLARDRHGDHSGGGGSNGQDDPAWHDNSRDTFIREERVRTLVVAQRWDVGVALTVASIVNIAMLVMAATSLKGASNTGTIEGAHAAIVAGLGPVIGIAFAIGLLASGLASTSVGAYAGDIVMRGMLHRHIPVMLRRCITLIPAFVVLGIGFNPTGVLVISQVVLSVAIPFALVPLVKLSGSRSLMGEHADAWWTKTVAWLVASAIIVLNVLLIVLAF